MQGGDWQTEMDDFTTHARNFMTSRFTNARIPRSTEMTAKTGEFEPSLIFRLASNRNMLAGTRTPPRRASAGKRWASSPRRLTPQSGDREFRGKTVRTLVAKLSASGVAVQYPLGTSLEREPGSAASRGDGWDCRRERERPREECAVIPAAQSKRNERGFLIHPALRGASRI